MPTSAFSAVLLKEADDRARGERQVWGRLRLLSSRPTNPPPTRRSHLLSRGPLRWRAYLFGCLDARLWRPEWEGPPGN
jgi:hypothetical protein